MKDEDLRRLLRNSLEGRRAPEGARERILAGFRRRIERRWLPAGAIAAGLLVAAALAPGLAAPLAGERALPAAIRHAFELHDQSGVDRHANQAITSRECADVIEDAIGRSVKLPGLRDAGFWQIEAHRCAETSMAHVIYRNSWSKLSCFVLDGTDVPLAGGARLSDPTVDGLLFTRGAMSAAAIREGGILKIWVSSLLPKDLESIAVDAELKRNQLKTLPLVVGVVDPRPMGAVLLGIPGVEDVQLEPARQEAFVRYDQRRVTPTEIAATLAVNGIEAAPREWKVKDDE
jgi:hypothetical protein